MKQLLPEILVTAPSGSTVTATFNGETIEGVPASSATQWKIDVLHLAKWHVTATNGTKSASKDVIVRDYAQFQTTITY